MLELYYKGTNKLLIAIDSANTNITRNERRRLQKRLESLLWEVSIDGFKRGYDACDIERGIQQDNENA